MFLERADVPAERGVYAETGVHSNENTGPIIHRKHETSSF